MSTVIRVPTPKKAGNRCNRGCYIKHADPDNDVKKYRYSLNTVIKCDDCGALWVVRPSPANMFSEYYHLRPLRWYHYAKRKLPRDVQA